MTALTHPGLNRLPLLTLRDAGKRRPLCPRHRVNGVQSEGIAVAGVDRPLAVKVAAAPDEWEQAFHLVTRCYQEHGYEPREARGIRFTPYHLLPETVTLVVKVGPQVVASFSLVPDNQFLGLPMEDIYRNELDELRAARRRLVEVTTFAAEGLAQHEFAPAVVALMRLGVQYMSANQQWDCQRDRCVIAVRRHHALFYRKCLGFVPWGPLRPHPKVCSEPREVEGLCLDPAAMKVRVPQLYTQVFDTVLPAPALLPVEMPWDLARRFAKRSSEPDRGLLNRLLRRRARTAVG